MALGGGGSGTRIKQGIRVWIVPGKIAIAGDDDHAYIEQTEMEVKLKSQYLETRSPSGANRGDKQGSLVATDAVAHDLVLPFLNDWVTGKGRSNPAPASSAKSVA